MSNEINMSQYAGETSIVMAVNYLIGVPEDVFANMIANHDSDYQKLRQNKNARVLRNLCRVRNAIVLNWESVSDQMTNQRKSIYTCDLIPKDAFDQLSKDGVYAAKSTHTMPEFTMKDVNSNIANRLGLCRHIFPDDIEWDRIRDVFMMPGGLSHSGAYHGAEAFRRQYRSYPQEVYANIKEGASKRVFEDDLTFLACIYGISEKDVDVQDCAIESKRSLESFLSASRKSIIIVDCENADPIRLCGTINMISDAARRKVAKVLLIDDEHTSPAWEIFAKYVNVPTEREVVRRIVSDKSLVDIKLATTASMEHYKNNVDSFVLASSDSDYWGMISTMKTAKFLLLLQEKKCSPHMQEAAARGNVPISWVDGITTQNAINLRDATLLQSVNDKLKTLPIDIIGAIEQAIKESLLVLTDEDRDAAVADYMNKLTFQTSDSHAWFKIKSNGGD